MIDLNVDRVVKDDSQLLNRTSTGDDFKYMRHRMIPSAALRHCLMEKAGQRLDLHGVNGLAQAPKGGVQDIH